MLMSLLAVILSQWIIGVYCLKGIKWVYWITLFFPVTENGVNNGVVVTVVEPKIGGYVT